MVQSKIATIWKSTSFIKIALRREIHKKYSKSSSIFNPMYNPSKLLSEERYSEVIFHDEKRN